MTVSVIVKEFSCR